MAEEPETRTDFAHAVQTAGVEQEPLCHGRLASIYMGHDANVTHFLYRHCTWHVQILSCQFILSSDLRRAASGVYRMLPCVAAMLSEFWPYALPDSTFEIQNRGGALIALLRCASLSIVCDNQFLHKNRL